MTDRADKKTQLLAETFHEDWASGRAAGFARAAALRARTRRRARVAISAGAAVMMVVTIGIVALRQHASAVLPVPRVAENRPAPPANPRGYEIISDDQLIAQLRDRPLLVVQRPNGSRQIVLLEDE